MKCPGLDELPAPPTGRRGWPWTEQSAAPPARTPQGREWPGMGVVTPSFNQGRYLEETIRSVLLQNYPKLTYVVVDGGSSDDSVRIIKKYERWLAHWESNKDRGQGHALNKGFARIPADAQLLGWMNSDDTYLPNGVRRIAEEFETHPEAALIAGQCAIQAFGWRTQLGPSPLRTYEDFLRVGSYWLKGANFVQPESFFRRAAFEATGGLSENDYIALDLRLWLEMLRQGYPFHSFACPIAMHRRHESQKTALSPFAIADCCRVAWEYLYKDWSRFDVRAPAIADDIFRALHDGVIRDYRVLTESKTYRWSRRVAQSYYAVQRLLKFSKPVPPTAPTHESGA